MLKQSKLLRRGEKALVDKMGKELGEVAIIGTRSTAKGWGPGPVEFFSSNTAAQNQSKAEMFQEWAQQKKTRFSFKH